MKKDIRLFYTSTSDDRTRPGFSGKILSTVKGQDVLLQKVAKVLLTRHGSDKFNTSLGSSLKTYLSSGSVTNDESTFSSYISIALDQVESFIKTQQADQILEDDETLVSLDLRSVTLDSGNFSWRIEVLVKNLKNETYLLRL